MKTFKINLSIEIRIWLVIFVFINIANVASIVSYQTEWKELYTQLGFVFLISLFLYLVVLFVRGIITLVKNK